MLESGEPREVHHFALLIGYGCGAINPYLAFETLDDMIRKGCSKNIDHKNAVKNYLKAAVKGVVKTMAKMGISTIQSYRGAQIFEAIGLNHAVVDKYFTWTASRVEGVGLDVIAEEALAAPSPRVSRPPGQRRGARRRRPVPMARRRRVSPVQSADDSQAAASPAATATTRSSRNTRHWSTTRRKSLCTLRGLLDFKSADNPIPIEEVEPVEDIVKRFKTGAMSYGSISQEAHEALAIAMNRIGGKSNTGEGGEDPDRYVWTDAQRRLEEQRHQTGRLRPLRRDQPLPRQGAGTADQDGPGRQARRRRRIARRKGLSVDRQNARSPRPASA